MGLCTYQTYQCHPTHISCLLLTLKMMRLTALGPQQEVPRVNLIEEKRVFLCHTFFSKSYKYGVATSVDSWKFTAPHHFFWVGFFFSSNFWYFSRFLQQVWLFSLLYIYIFFIIAYWFWFSMSSWDVFRFATLSHPLIIVWKRNMLKNHASVLEKELHVETWVLTAETWYWAWQIFWLT